MSEFKPTTKHLSGKDWDDFLEYLQLSDTPTFKDFIEMKIHYAFSEHFNKSYASLVHGVSEWDNKLYEVPLDEGDTSLIWFLLKVASNENNNIVEDNPMKLEDIEPKDIDDLLYRLDHIYKGHPNAKEFGLIPKE